MIQVKVMRLLPNAIGSDPRFMMANSTPAGGTAYLPAIPETGSILRLYTLNLVRVHMVYMEENDRDVTIFVAEV